MRTSIRMKADQREHGMIIVLSCLALYCSVRRCTVLFCTDMDAMRCQDFQGWPRPSVTSMTVQDGQPQSVTAPIDTSTSIALSRVHTAAAAAAAPSPSSITIGIIFSLRSVATHNSNNNMQLVRSSLARRALPSAAVARTIAARRPLSASSQLRSAESHGDHYDPPGGWLFGVKPGEKYQSEGWENIFYWGFFGSMAFGVIGYCYKPDTRCVGRRRHVARIRYASAMHASPADTRAASRHGPSRRPGDGWRPRASSRTPSRTSARRSISSTSTWALYTTKQNRSGRGYVVASHDDAARLYIMRRTAEVHLWAACAMRDPPPKTRRDIQTPIHLHHSNLSSPCISLAFIFHRNLSDKKLSLMFRLTPTPNSTSVQLSVNSLYQSLVSVMLVLLPKPLHATPIYPWAP